MTREEAIQELTDEFNIFLEGTGLDDEEYLEAKMKENENLRCVVEANRMAIKALKEVERYKYVIENIKVEISKERDSCGNFTEGIATAYGLKLALEIIDKHVEVIE